MKPTNTRRLLLGGLALALVAALAFVALRTGPLAPVKVQWTWTSGWPRWTPRSRGRRAHGRRPRRRWATRRRGARWRRRT
ncbi:MAG: hypothetical protein A3G82_02245 [Burkholderiales bacterium RIFCSPLOWO2_12_FULL_67_210]|nr:MAG: hypothetical protein A3G82_02245 [Burkholderiales bacterium RIFCSPLOWO2_12_FULL_67_210]